MSDHNGISAGSDPLTRAAEAARVAPSIHNTQPWRWRVGGGVLELHAERSRQLTAIDAEGRMLMVSCGAALHHARVALAAQGYHADVLRFPQATTPDLLARIVLGEHTIADPATMRMYQTTLIRQTDRRPVPDLMIAMDAVQSLHRAAAAEGVSLQVLHPDQVIELAVTVSRAEAVEAVDAEQREELARWVGGLRADGLGVPDTVIPADLPRTVVPEREFGRAGTLPSGEGHDSSALYAVLHTEADTQLDWLRGGEALSAIWLTGVEEGLSLLPFSAPIEVAGARQVLRRILADLGYPVMVVRLGLADDVHAGPPHTPRLAARQVIERAEEQDPA